jgi:hypothetical protein
MLSQSHSEQKERPYLSAAEPADDEAGRDRLYFGVRVRRTSPKSNQWPLGKNHF